MHKLARIGAAACGGAVVAVVLIPPRATDARELFSAHMIQHLLLIVVAAPLFAIAGAIGVLPAPVAQRVTSPALAWSLFTASFLFWHWPTAFRWAAHGEATRLLEHATILVTATLFWSVALSKAGPQRLSHGAAALFVTTAAVVTDLPGVIMLFAPTPVCAMPQEDAARWGLTALQDQQFAGLLMWVPANLIFFSFATWLLASWMSEGDRRNVQSNSLVAS
jgi:putative membrane protein